MREVERSAPSVEEAIELALADLGASEQEVSVQILQDPKGGFLGVGAQDAVVRVRLTGPPPAAVPDEELEEQADLTAEFLEGVIARLGIDADVDTEFRGGTMYVEVVPREANESEDAEEDMGLLIGRHGQTLEALQDLARTLVANRTGQRPRILVDIEGYRRRQRARLESRVREAAKRVARTGREEILEPMNAYDRKLAHDAVAGVRGVESSSQGEEPERRVVIRRRSS